MRVAVVGASGRMGRAIVRLATAGGEIVCAVAATDLGRDVGELAGVGPLGMSVGTASERSSSRAPTSSSTSRRPRSRSRSRPIAAAAGIALVSGTTGLDDEATRAPSRCAAKRVAGARGSRT